MLGVTAREPLTATVPMPWSMLAEVAFEEDHESVEVPPTLIEEGAAAMLASGTWFTFTVTESVAVPEALVTVMV